MTDICTCGHPRTVHDYRDGCLRFLCCDRTRNLTPGRRHTEHDGAGHRPSYCPCNSYSPKDTP